VRLKRMVGRAIRPTPLISGGFLAVTAAVVANAILLQSARHPAPLFETLQGEVVAETAPDAHVEAIQAALREAGYYPGPLDGIAGEQTRAAIAAYEQKLGWAPTGAASRSLLAALQAGASARRTTADAGEHAAPTIVPDGRVAAVQEALAKAAYGPLKADGLFGPQTRDAIVRFQQDHGLSVNGEINDALIIELRAAGALGDE
jgi:peptidoglycan hydrolase-like protein with peptidoglycan-binding domain